MQHDARLCTPSSLPHLHCAPLICPRAPAAAAADFEALANEGGPPFLAGYGTGIDCDGKITMQCTTTVSSASACAWVHCPKLVLLHMCP